MSDTATMPWDMCEHIDSLAIIKFGYDAVQKLRDIRAAVPIVWPDSIRFKLIDAECSNNELHEVNKWIGRHNMTIHREQTSKDLNYLGPPTGIVRLCLVHILSYKYRFIYF